MPKKGKRGQGRFSKNSSSNRSQRNGGFRRHDVRADASPANNTASPINASHDRAANYHPPIVDGSDSDRSDSESDDDYDENKPTISDSLSSHWGPWKQKCLYPISKIKWQGRL